MPASTRQRRSRKQDAEHVEDESFTTVPQQQDEAKPSESTASKASAKRKRGTVGEAKPLQEGRQYWLMKAEQEDREVKAHSGKMINAKFTIDDLKSRTKPEPWDGVRNVVARNNMRAMKKGDMAFFYASGGSGKLKPGITGIMEIVKEHEPDWTVSDEDAYGYVEPGKRGSDEKPQWSLVHVEFREKLSTPVTLKEMQEHKGPGAALSGLQVLTHSRISVSKVSPEQWRFIVDELIGKQSEST